MRNKIRYSFTKRVRMQQDSCVSRMAGRATPRSFKIWLLDADFKRTGDVKWPADVLDCVDLRCQTSGSEQKIALKVIDTETVSVYNRVVV